MRPRGSRKPRPGERPLGGYTDLTGRPRELITHKGHGGSLLVIDRDAATHGDRRLIAHLAADEPAENAAIVCRRYLEHPPCERGRCRRVTAADAETLPQLDDDEQAELELDTLAGASLRRGGCRHRLVLLDGAMSIPELRWVRLRHEGAAAGQDAVSLREVVARLESYEPVCSITRRALRAHGESPEVSTTALGLELARVQRSPIVLNRRLREVALAMIERDGLSMSAIAIRCGRVKRDCKGNESGETSWLARRLGLLPEGGQSAPTPWIHSDVLALIARCGLGVSPREVEL
ncbi:MAG TPA: hypothetical protein VKG62_00905 [Solirubrobacteraceae bacterium]|nr:hypothetical protein [Solirubrobacteraceae bacterium]